MEGGKEGRERGREGRREGGKEGEREGGKEDLDLRPVVEEGCLTFLAVAIC